MLPEVNEIIASYDRSLSTPSALSHDEVLSELRLTWNACPTLRLGQLICVVIKSGKDQFYMEDSTLLEKLRDFRKEQEVELP